MNDELTPKNMLREYRRQSIDPIREQAEALKELTEPERLELLFYMIANVTASMQHLHSMIDAEGSKTKDFAEIKSSTQ